MEITRQSGKEEIIEFIKARSASCGHTLLKSEVSDEEKRIISRIFGSWINAVKASGLENPNSPQQTAIRLAQCNSKKSDTSTIWKK